MKKIVFRDPVAREFLKTAVDRISINESQFVREQADRLRFSTEIKERLTSAVFYAALGENSADNHNWKNSALLLHFSGQAFRSIGMTAKAGFVYQSSFEAGNIAVEFFRENGSDENAESLEKFNLRSIGRAINCYKDAGLFDKSIAAKRVFQDARTVQLKSSKQAFSYMCSTAWKYLLDYSLTWERSASFLFTTTVLFLAIPGLFTQTLEIAGAFIVLVVCIRRFV